MARTTTSNPSNSKKEINHGAEKEVFRIGNALGQWGSDPSRVLPASTVQDRRDFAASQK